MYAHLYEESPKLREFRPEVPPELEAICTKMMAKRPDDRYQSMADVVLAIEELGIVNWQAGASGATWPGSSSSSGWFSTGLNPSGLSPLLIPEDAPVTKTSEVDDYAQSRSVNSLGMVLVSIPAGDFAMGAASDEADACDDEKPRRWFRTSEYWMAVHPTTQEQFQAVMAKNPSWFSPTGNGKLKVAAQEAATHPVERVTWFEAIEFCNRLSESEGLSPYYRIDGKNVDIAGGDGYRLPTEREWEYACRAGNAGPYSFGDNENQLGEYGWFDLNSGLATHQVGMKLPNRWGLFDMHGNVWEWCWDWHHPSYESISDPNGPATGKRRILRGGAFFDPSHKLRSARRSSESPDIRLWDYGFRVARTKS